MCSRAPRLKLEQFFCRTGRTTTPSSSSSSSSGPTSGYSIIFRSPRVAVGGTTQPNIWHVFYLQSALHTKIVRHNFAFGAMEPSTGNARVLAASSKTTVHHGATTLSLASFPLLSECFGDRHNRHRGVHTRVYAPLIETRGDFVVCLTQPRRVFEGFKKSVSSRHWFTHFFYSSSFVGPPLGFQTRASWCTELESPA